MAGAAAAAFYSPRLVSWMILDRERFLGGEWWRAITCHFVHFNARHLIYDLTAFGIACLMIEFASRRRLFALNGFMAIAISLTLLITEPDMRYYGGLSGLATGAIFYLALIHVRDNGAMRWVGLFMLVSLPLKTIAELWMGGSIFPYPENTPFIAVPLSHILGIAVAGAFFIMEKSVIGSAKKAKP